MSISANTYARIPNYDELTEALGRIAAEKKRLNAWRRPSPITSSDFVDAALTGDGFPNLGDHNLSIQNEALAVRDSVAMLSSAAKTIESERAQAVQDNAHLGFDYLRSELKAVLTKVKAVDEKLGHVRTADEVVALNDPDTSEAWNSLQGLISDYSVIRQTQVQLYQNVVSTSQAKHVFAVGFFADSMNSSDMWLNRRFDAANASPVPHHQDRATQAYIDWLRADVRAVSYPASNGAFPDGVDRRQYLLWVATKAKPWMPNAQQVLDAYAAATSATSPVDARSLAGSEEARDRFYEVTGTTPRSSYNRSNAQTQTGRGKMPRAYRAALNGGF